VKKQGDAHSSSYWTVDCGDKDKGSRGLDPRKVRAKRHLHHTFSSSSPRKLPSKMYVLDRIAL
jgi:hypothetical protein